MQLCLEPKSRAAGAQTTVMARLITRHHDPYHAHALVVLKSTSSGGLVGHGSVLAKRPRKCTGFGANVCLDAIALVMLPLPNLTSFLFSGVPIIKPKGSEGDTIWQEYPWSPLGGHMSSFLRPHLPSHPQRQTATPALRLTHPP